ncbi:hypothetical protein [Nocardiopsis sp. NRRL B-16309]|uniref:hypothetical protein n=1 Tax=Nocardiopsis sp. NRRL B-16309 TaxID=1519494 RepID=UPI0006ADC168|nr:hypothetical protein [Nocardiopsis sp. NRRL B-16309]KOX10191.1 hypothetical protein ADL05_26320 [Nocardiopsis sp. NRRL B-16309]
MTEIAIRAEDSLADRIYYAQTLAKSGMLPKQYRQSPENVLYAIEYGRGLGLDPIRAMNSVHVIEGRPSPSSGLIGAMVRKAGHRLRVRVERGQSGPVAIAQIIRSDDPEWTFESQWDMDRARRAGVAGKQVWKSYPEAMLKARAITEVAREACEEALLGFSHSAEELGAEVDEDGNVVDARPAQVRPGATIAEAVAESAPDTPQVVDDQGVPDELVRRMGGLMRMLSMGQADALPFVSEVVGREIRSRADMTEDEILQVVDALEDRLKADREANQEPEVADAEIVPDAPQSDPWGAEEPSDVTADEQAATYAEYADGAA